MEQMQTNTSFINDIIKTHECQKTAPNTPRTDDANSKNISKNKKKANRKK